MPAIKQDIGAEHQLLARQHVDLNLADPGAEGHVFQLLAGAVATGRVAAAPIIPCMSREADLQFGIAGVSCVLIRSLPFLSALIKPSCASAAVSRKLYTAEWGLSEARAQ